MQWVPRFSLRDPSDAMTKEPDVMCDVSSVSSEWFRLRTAPRIHFSDFGSVRGCCESEDVIGGEMVVGVRITSQQLAEKRVFP